MRAVFIGAGPETVMASRFLLDGGHEVVIVEQDRGRIEALAEELDCGFLHGDGSKPALLREADPGGTDALFCMTGNDQANIIASLVGRSLGFERIFTRIDDPEFEHICLELGLEDTIVPSRTVGRHLAESLEGKNPVEFSVFIKDDARLYSFVAEQREALPVAELDLPKNTRVVCLYRHDRFVPVTGDSAIHADDEVVLITETAQMDRLEQRWGPPHGLDAGRRAGLD